ncbi:MAG TPA: Ca2+-dependent phosphoinositide-specific phospholipase C [Polyangiaceae bacterium]|jgi:hypothetical protein|nr:Ca2+-dependent phosphoinositide-specific phospholipase C [Polyangiaceae bacterium]
MKLRRFFIVASTLALSACPDSAPPDDGDAMVVDASPEWGPPLPWSADATPHLPLDGVLRISDVQALGTHNSYHVESPGNTVPDWHYTMPALGAQLDLGVRQLELDIHFFDQQPLQVFHIGALDGMTTCFLFHDCLLAIATWSSAHVGHAPLYIQIEPKTGFPDASTSDAGADNDQYFAEVESEILSVFVRERIITPDEVQAGGASLGQTVSTVGWPTFATTRGRVLFTFDNDDSVRAAYSRNQTSLANRLLFVDSAPGDPIAAVTILNDPIVDAPKITAALAAHMIVRVTADDPAADPTTNAATLDASLAVSATWISTNFPAPTTDGGYYGFLPDGSPRCNPATAPAQCAQTDIEQTP